MLVDDGLESGDILHKAQLAELFELRPPVTAAQQVKWQTEWFVQMQEFRNELLVMHRMALRTMYGESSYCVIPAGEQTDFAMRTGVKEIAKATRRMAKTLLFVRHDMLTAEQSRQNADALAKTAMLAGMVRKTRLIGKPS